MSRGQTGGGRGGPPPTSPSPLAPLASACSCPQQALPPSVAWCKPPLTLPLRGCSLMSCSNLTLSPLVASQSFSLSSLPSFCPRYGGMEHIQGRVALQMRERISPPPPPLSRVVCCVSSSSLPRLVHALAVASCIGEGCLSRGLPHLCPHCFALRCSSPPAPR